MAGAGVMLGMAGVQYILAVIIFFVAEFPLEWMKCNFIDAAISWFLKIEDTNLDAKNVAISKRRRYYLLRRVITLWPGPSPNPRPSPLVESQHSCMLCSASHSR